MSAKRLPPCLPPLFVGERPTSAELVKLPVIRVERMNLDALEQRDRERGGYLDARVNRPPRTRPLLVIDNARSDGDALRRAFGK